MDEISIFVAIQFLRGNPTYHAAEVLRRNTQGGSRAMATAAEGSPERQAVFTLISTWEAIALMMSDLKRKDRIFSNTPVCHMYRALEPAITYFANQFPDYGANFKKLNTEYEAWYSRKKFSAQYVTELCNGMHARFG